MEIRILRRQGQSIRQISKMPGVSRNTVRRYLRHDQAPGHQRQVQRPNKLDPHKPHLVGRDACHAPPRAAPGAASERVANPPCALPLPVILCVPE